MKTNLKKEIKVGSFVKTIAGPSGIKSFYRVREFFLLLKMEHYGRFLKTLAAELE